MEADPDIIRRRLPRYARLQSLKPPLVLQPRDYEIIELVEGHRFISSDDIQLLVPGSNQVVLRRLQKLFHHRYLDRPRVQKLNGNIRMVYALGPRGADEILHRTGRKPAGDWSEKNRQVRERYLAHALMVSRFRTALHYACDRVGTVAVERWLGDGAMASSVDVECNGYRNRIPIRPDAFFILNVIDGASPGRVHVFLEADRGTMTVARFVEKLHGYFEFWRSGAVEGILGVRNFVVLTTTTSPERAGNLAKASYAVADHGLRMFLFGTEADYLPASKLSVVDRVWHSPSDAVRHSLLE